MSKFDTLIIDIESYVYQACTSCKTIVPMEKGEKNKFVEIYDLRLGQEYINNIIQQFKDKFICGSVVLVIGDKNNNFRKGLNPMYKSARGSKPLMYDKLIDWMVGEHNVVSLPTLEADDICRIVYEDDDNFKGEKLIITIDKDFYSVPCNLYRDNPKDRVVVQVTDTDARLNEFVQVVMGDKTDGYSGIPNFGEKKARDFITLTTTWEDIVKLYIANKTTEEEAIMNYNMAHIVGKDDYDIKTYKVKPRTLPKAEAKEDKK